MDKPQSQRRSQAERSAKTRSLLIQAAIVCAAAKGVGAVTTADVAQEAGLTRGAVQHHFGGIREIWLAVIENAWSASLEAYRDAPGVDVPLEERIRGWVAASHDGYQSELGRIAVEIFVAHRADQDFIARARPAMLAAEEQLNAQWTAALADVVTEESRALRLRRILRDNALGSYLRGIIVAEDPSGPDDLSQLLLSLIQRGTL